MEWQVTKDNRCLNNKNVMAEETHTQGTYSKGAINSPTEATTVSRILPGRSTGTLIRTRSQPLQGSRMSTSRSRASSRSTASLLAKGSKTRPVRRERRESSKSLARALRPRGASMCQDEWRPEKTICFSWHAAKVRAKDSGMGLTKRPGKRKGRFFI